MRCRRLSVVMSITLGYAGLMALFSVLLANYVLYVRLRAKTVPDWQPRAAERVQANFAENVPLTLVVLYLVEVAGAANWFVHGGGVSLVVLRALHAWGLARYSGANYPRLIGAQGTFALLAILGAAALLIALSG